MSFDNIILIISFLHDVLNFLKNYLISSELAENRSIYIYELFPMKDTKTITQSKF